MTQGHSNGDVYLFCKNTSLHLFLLLLTPHSLLWAYDFLGAHMKAYDERSLTPKAEGIS